MNWYFASRTRHKEKIKEVAVFLESKGETIVSSWIHTSLAPPYDANIETAHEFTEKITAELLRSDVFVLISDEGGTDMFIELGICIAKNVFNPNSIRIYIVGEHSKRSLLQLHPAVVHLPTLKEVLEKESAGAGFNIPDLN